MDDLERNAELGELILRIADREEQAFRLLHERTAPNIFTLAMRYVRRYDLAEDVRQECFVTIWKTAGTFQTSFGTPMSWVATIVKRRSLDMLRTQVARRCPISEEYNEFFHIGVDVISTDPMEHASNRESVEALLAALSRLPGKQRRLLTLAFLRELTHAEIAEQHNLPLGTVKTSIRSGLAKLQRQISSIHSQASATKNAGSETTLRLPLEE